MSTTRAAWDAVGWVDSPFAPPRRTFHAAAVEIEFAVDWGPWRADSSEQRLGWRPRMKSGTVNYLGPWSG